MSFELKDLLVSLPRDGKVEWIGIRPARRAQMIVVDAVEARMGQGLTGDRFSGGPTSKRQVTLLQAEHLPVIAQLIGFDRIDPAVLRRNLVVSGINLLALHGCLFSVGDVVMEGSGYCHPCSRMEEELGIGGYNAVRGHGGITARVVRGGVVRLHDMVRFQARP